MRNLKKILALALALVMTLSLMTVANAFNDDKDIDATYDEAVTVLSGLKVFKGVNDGSNFAPKQTITRAEVAAIIYRIVTGDVNDTQAGYLQGLRQVQGRGAEPLGRWLHRLLLQR